MVQFKDKTKSSFFIPCLKYNLLPKEIASILSLNLPKKPIFILDIELHCVPCSFTKIVSSLFLLESAM